MGKLSNGLCFSELKKESRGRDEESTSPRAICGNLQEVFQLTRVIKCKNQCKNRGSSSLILDLKGGGSPYLTFGLCHLWLPID